MVTTNSIVQLLLENAFFLASLADSPNELRRAFSVLAERFVLDHREGIEKLAIALDQRRSMTGAEVREFLVSVGK
ncbi:MAG: hypothetical protein AAAC47_09230 [Pararhizobium sp.]